MRFLLALLALLAPPAGAICFNPGEIDKTGTQLSFLLRHLTRAPAPPYYPDCSCDVCIDGGGATYGIYVVRVCGKVAAWRVQAFGALGSYCTWAPLGADALRFDCHCRLPPPQLCTSLDYAGWLDVELNTSAPCVLYAACSAGRCV